jgi:surface antigen
LPLIFLTIVTLVGNIRERYLAASFFNPRFYTKNEIEGFVSAISPFTLVLEEEPSLAAEILAYDQFDLTSSEYIEKPILTETASSIPLSSGQNETEQPSRRTSIITYSVKEGDTLSVIAQRFGLSIKTLADVNDISAVNNIRPGQTLSIPPDNGIIYTVKKGDTLSTIVKKFQGDLEETKKYTSENIKEGQKILVVGGKVPQAPPPSSPRFASSRNVLTRNNSSAKRTLLGEGSRNNGYPWGWCTWYAAYRRHIPSNWGNAGQWLASARRAGYATGSTPQVGAIIVTSESWYGHVGYVEAVGANSVTISEMNYRGWGTVSQRTIPANSGIIKGYIY